MYWWNCGTKLPENAGFCFACGKSQAEDAPEAAGTVGSSGPVLPPAAPVPPAPAVATPLSNWRSLPTAQAYAEPDPPNRIAGFLALGAAILVIVGSFSPWVTVTIFIGSVEVNGMDGDGKITLWCGLGAVALLAVHLFAGSHPTWTAFLAIAVLLLSGIIGVADWTDLNDSLTSAMPSDVDVGVFASVGWGLQVMTIASFAGALLAGIQGIIALRR